MEKTEIIEGNILIADFMGWEKTKVFRYPFFWCKKKQGWKHIDYPGFIVFSEFFKYHNDWNWIMRVAKKVNYENEKSDDAKMSIYRINMHEAISYADIENCFKSIINLIKSLTQQPESK